jgi:hypothetical protein
MPRDPFRTSDLALTAYLMLCGYTVRKIETDGQGKGTFVLDDRPERPGRVLEFFNRKAAVEPLAFLDQLKTLKSLLRQ